MSLSVHNPIHDNPEPTSFAEVLQGLPSPTSWELHKRTVLEGITEANGYLQGVEHAMRVNEHDHAIRLFLKACRITYILLPAHPECAHIQSTDEIALLLRKLRDRIEDNHAAVMTFATPAKLIQEARKVYPSSPDTPSLDTSISPPSPTRSTPTYGGIGLDSKNVHLIPPTTTYTSAPPISATVVNASVQALFDEASALFGHLQPLSQNDSPPLSNNPIEDTTFLDPGWTVHRREISEPDVFAALYEQHSTRNSVQNNNDMFVNNETGGGRDVQLFADRRSSDLYDSVPYDDFNPALYQHRSMTTSTLDIDLSSVSSTNYGFFRAEEPFAQSSGSHYGESTSSPPTFLSDYHEKSSSPPTKNKNILSGKKRSSTGNLTDEISAMKMRASPINDPKSGKRVERKASTSSTTIVFASTSSNEVKAVVTSAQRKPFWPKMSTMFNSNTSKVNPTQLDPEEKEFKKKPPATYPPLGNGIPTYMPLISFMPQQQHARRSSSHKKKKDLNSIPKVTVNANSQPSQIVPGEQTSDRLDPNESREQDRPQATFHTDDQNSRSNIADHQVYNQPSDNQNDKRDSFLSGYSLWTPPNTSIPNPIIARLRVHARSNLGCIKYMSFAALVSYSNDCFSNMRMYSEKKDYANAYTHGLQGMIIVTNVLPQRPECRPEAGAAYYNYVSAVEVNILCTLCDFLNDVKVTPASQKMIHFKYKEMLKALQNKIEQEYQTM